MMNVIAGFLMNSHCIMRGGTAAWSSATMSPRMCKFTEIVEGMLYMDVVQRGGGGGYSDAATLWRRMSIVIREHKDHIKRVLHPFAPGTSTFLDADVPGSATTTPPRSRHDAATTCSMIKLVLDMMSLHLTGSTDAGGGGQYAVPESMRAMLRCPPQVRRFVMEEWTESALAAMRRCVTTDAEFFSMPQLWANIVRFAAHHEEAHGEASDDEDEDEDEDEEDASDDDIYNF
jgi:hypothetical protein